MTERPGKNDVSTGVQTLIEQLKAQGVNSGREEAAAIVAEAQAEAESLINQARLEAERLQKAAQQQADFTTRAGIDALQMAGRDAILELKEYLIEQFSQQIASLINHSLTDKGLIEKIILEIAGQQSTGNEPIEVILPEKVIGIEALRKDPELVKQGRLLSIVTENTAAMLKEEVTFKTGDSDDTGIRFRLSGQNVEIDLSDKAVTSILLKHLQPRFRALLEGIIK